MMRPVHLRMARAALNRTLREIEVMSGVNKNTLSRYEAGGSILSDTLERIESVFKAEGVIFIDEDAELGPGIRLRREPKPAARVGSDRRNRKTKPKSSSR